MVVVSDLIYSKVSNKPARWVLAVADDSPYQKPEDLAGKRIATELMGVCTEYFKERNIPSTSTIRGARPKPRLWKASPTPSWK